MSAGPLVVVESSAGNPDRPRLPLADLDGMPMLEFQLRRLLPLTGHIGAAIVVATTDRPIDDPIAEVARGLGLAVVRGTKDDVLGRFSIAHVRHGGDVIVRLTDDSPLSDPFMVMAALGLHQETTADYTSNLLPRTYPKGLEVEVLTARALRMAEIEATDESDRRRVTSYVLRRPDRFRLANLQSGHDLGEETWRVETHEDLARMRDIVAQVPTAATASWNHILSVTGRANKPSPGQVVLVPGPPPEPGSPTWERTWRATVDGADVGLVRLVVTDGRIQRDFELPEEWLEPGREALYRLLLDDPQAGP